MLWKLCVQYQSSCATKLARKCEIEHWFSCGADRRAGGRCTVTWLPHFLRWVDLLTHDAPQARFARQSSAITWPCGDIQNFSSSVEKYFTIAWAQRMSEIFFQHAKRNFVSPSDHVMFYSLYKHQWNAKPFYWNSFLVWKVRFIMKP